jgi:hypothetical protein
VNGAYAPSITRTIAAPVRWADLRRGRLALQAMYVWAALLGIQLDQPFIPNFHLAISDFVLAFVLFLVMSDREAWRRALALPYRLGWFFSVLAIALTIGCLMDFVYYGFVPTDAWLNKGVGLGVLVAVVVCVRAAAYTRDALIGILKALLWGALASAVIAILVWASQLVPNAAAARFTGFLLNPNAAALFYTVCLLLLLGAAAGAPYAIGEKTARIAAIVVLGLTNIVSLSLSGLAGGVVGLGALVITLGRGRVPAAAGFLLASVLVLSTLQFVLAPLLTGSESDVFALTEAARSGAGKGSVDTGSGVLSVYQEAFASGSAQNKAASVFDRVAIDVVALDLWLTDPGTVFFGIGVGAFPLYAVATAIATSVIIHNTYLWLLVEMGIPGVIAMGILLWYVAGLCLQLFRRVDRPTAAAITAAFACFLVWWLFNEGLYQRLFWLLIGVASVLVQLGPQWTRRIPRVSRTFVSRRVS